MKIKIAENIKALRKQHSFTQEQLAEALGVTTGAVYKWESGQSVPEVKLIMALADLFETSVDTLSAMTDRVGISVTGSTASCNMPWKRTGKRVRWKRKRP